MYEKGIEVLKRSEIYKRFFKEENKLNSDEWNKLIHIIEQIFPSFIERLQELYPMSEQEIRICLLIKIEIPLGQIALILMRSKQAITSIRKRLYKKVFKQEGKAEDWDRFIHNF